ncbi:hypothetical protein [Amycolatopsis regifaucium]|uniref:hypothetical protein n=1 Tax=Amycolatopsis regifaucium TaxID=546365 RepID=UPI001160CDE2|nr:hypothetical protein [Amycolatopsis regifaucium]
MTFGGWRPKEKIVKTWKAVVLRVEHDDERQGVLKANLADGTLRTRFRNDILGMRQMSEAGIEGVLRVLDAVFQENPMWFVMPEATPLAQHLARSRQPHGPGRPRHAGDHKSAVNTSIYPVRLISN